MLLDHKYWIGGVYGVVALIEVSVTKTNGLHYKILSGFLIVTIFQVFMYIRTQAQAFQFDSVHFKMFMCIL